MTVGTGSVLDGRYELGRTLGRGGMGRVFLAHDTRLGRDVAVKVLEGGLASDEEFLARFQREARAAASLSHPGIVAVFDRGEQDGTHYIVMEFVDGPSLAEVLRSYGRLEPQRVVALGAAIAAALGAAHRIGLVHRDVKPSNVLVTPEGHVKVTDFGIARSASDTTLTTADSVLGSVPYVAPEQVRGQPATAASDVYALGCLLYALLTGEPPFRGEVAVSVLHQHLSQDPELPSGIRDDVPTEVDEALMALLAKDPGQRPADGDQAAALLRASAGGGLPDVLPLVPMDVLERTRVVDAIDDRTRAMGQHDRTHVLTEQGASAGGDADVPVRWGRRLAVLVLLVLVLVAVALFGDRLTSGGAGPGADSTPSPAATVASPQPSPVASPESIGDVVDRIGDLLTSGRGSGMSDEVGDKLGERLLEIVEAIREQDWGQARSKSEELSKEVEQRAEKGDLTPLLAAQLQQAISDLERVLPPDGDGGEDDDDEGNDRGSGRGNNRGNDRDD